MQNQEDQTRSIDQPLAELGNYVLLEKLGEGGMGEVFRAKHKVMGRVVAIKMLSAAELNNQMAVERFQREVRAIAKLQHPNIVAAYDPDQSDGQAFLVMEYVKGVDLAQLVKRQGPVSVELAVDYVQQAARGLEHAHQAGIVHRDIKPANLVLDETGVVKILDMGLVRLDQDEEQQNLTDTGQVVGTVTYMSPEQAMSTKHVDARTDIYSLGCTLYFLLTGTAPFKGESAMQTLMAHRIEPIPKLPQASPELQAVYERMLAKQPNERYASMTECLGELSQLQLLGNRKISIEQTDRTQEATDVAVSNFISHAANSTRPQGDVTTSQCDLISRQDTVANTSSARSWFQSPIGIASLGGGGLILLLLTVVFMLRTPSGMLVIEINEPGVTVSVDGEQRVLIQRPGEKTAVQVEVDHEQHELKVTKDGFAMFTTEFSMKGKKEQTIRVRLQPLTSPLADTTRLTVGKKAGEEWHGNSLNMTFCWCPPGKFVMGSPETEKDRCPQVTPTVRQEKNETQVEVTLTRGYWMGKHEVTQAEYEQVMKENPSLFSGVESGSWKVIGQDTTRFPVEQVSWHDAAKFCQKLTEQERVASRLPLGWEYRLPTEAEWEYACRAGTTTATYLGDRLSSKQANFNGESYNGAEQGPFLGRPRTVGSYAANAWGLHDMYGNVYEWCQDWYADQLPGGRDPLGKSGSARVSRGGGWEHPGRFCRSAFRYWDEPNFYHNIVGFRAVLAPSVKPPVPAHAPKVDRP